jgi:glycosyltransferase involved in cell wall biosynthesis
MKVLIVSHSYVAAENQKNIVALQQYAEVKVVVPHAFTDPILGRLEPGEVDGNSYLVYRRLSLPRNQYLLTSSDLEMRAFKPDIVHIEYDPWASIFWQTLCAKTRYVPNARIVCTVKKNTLRDLPTPLQAIKVQLARYLLNKVDHIIAINEGVKRIYISKFSVSQKKLTIMQHLGVDLLVFSPAAPQTNRTPLIVGYCGRFELHKGVVDLVEAFAGIQRARPGSGQLRLLGSGMLRDQLLARQEPWLEISPPVPHSAVADFLCGLDIFVLPSQIKPDYEEEDAHALMEAMGCGVACIGSSSGVIPELLSDGCGSLYSAGNQGELGDAIISLMDDAGRRESIAKRARARALQSLSVEHIAAQKAAIYSKALE